MADVPLSGRLCLLGFSPAPVLGSLGFAERLINGQTFYLAEYFKVPQLTAPGIQGRFIRAILELISHYV